MWRREQKTVGQPEAEKSQDETVWLGRIVVYNYNLVDVEYLHCASSDPIAISCLMCI